MRTRAIKEAGNPISTPTYTLAEIQTDDT